MLYQHAELALVGFHTLFNLLGVLLVLPVAGRFAGLVVRLVPGRAAGLGKGLDKALLKEPGVALDAAAHVAGHLVSETLKLVRDLLESPDDRDETRLKRVGDATDRVQAYVDDIHLLPEQAEGWRRLNGLIHLLDHLQRLLDRCEEEPERVKTLAAVTPLRTAAINMNEMLAQVLQLSRERQWTGARDLTASLAQHLDAQAELMRASIMADMASGKLLIPEGTSQLEAVRWLRRGSAHVARIFAHLAEVDL
jgi:phosphate:Na+ symporter